MVLLMWIDSNENGVKFMARLMVFLSDMHTVKLFNISAVHHCSYDCVLVTLDRVRFVLVKSHCKRDWQ